MKILWNIILILFMVSCASQRVIKLEKSNDVDSKKLLGKNLYVVTPFEIVGRVESEQLLIWSKKVQFEDPNVRYNYGNPETFKKCETFKVVESIEYGLLDNALIIEQNSKNYLLKVDTNRGQYPTSILLRKETPYIKNIKMIDGKKVNTKNFLCNKGSQKYWEGMYKVELVFIMNKWPENSTISYINGTESELIVYGNHYFYFVNSKLKSWQITSY